MANTAELRVQDELEHALPRDQRMYRNVRWISKPESDGPARDGETDIVIVDPDDGLLVVEVKSGPIRRDSYNRWWSGQHRIEPPPFQQAERSKRALQEKLV